MRKPAVVCFALFSWAIVACGNARPVTPKPYLEPYPGSRVLVSGAEHGVDGIQYEVSAPYPPDQVVKFIESRVPPEFRPRRENFLNPGVPTAHVRGWTSFADHSTRPHSAVHQWDGEWEDPDGNILTYTLQYRSPGDDLQRPATTRLQVMGSLLTREEVAATRKAVGR